MLKLKKNDMVYFPKKKISGQIIHIIKNKFGYYYIIILNNGKVIKYDSDNQTRFGAMYRFDDYDKIQDYKKLKNENKLEEFML